ncbi:SDR family NAD(P)-dependent oxidoreductase [Amycolatopsis cihanbeyliensis]|uniref:Short-subunit dehydrogenase n=1 Tax=Amycolatopsis cihanbeyliensis TaxID=1128664 RepID=A0A542DS09_AMYCI|nr:SDR family NAD(P)-dependent oxidoreductase [Amycolatopsis cihanbeyliensis]TQJ05860.1 short-subunit dehydrogenase [Amycolatopsis cihanbeyliensis]
MSGTTSTAHRTRAAAAVVTGAGSGIGRAFAMELARRGGSVVCADLDPAAAKDTAAMIEAGGGRALPTGCDVSIEAQVWDVSETAERWLGRPAGLVVNNAGIGTGGRVVGETPLADWRRTLEVNLWGVVHGCHVFTPWLREAGRGGIINVASAAAFAAAPRMAAYNASKAAVLSISETLAAELAGTGVAVTVLCPTFVRTNIVSGELIDAAAARAAAMLMRLTGSSPDRIARRTLDAHDRGLLHALPQWDARLVWRGKRFFPGGYTRAAGLIGRWLPVGENSEY